MSINKEIIDNYKRNERWLDWFLERRKTFLPGGELGRGILNKEQIEAIKIYFTEQEQKIISWGLSHIYMLEKFRCNCLRIAPNLSLIDFQKLCYSWWGSNEKGINHKDLVNKGRLNSEQWKELDKILKEEEIKNKVRTAEDFFEIKLEEWLSQEVSEPKLKDYKEEHDLEKRAEILKERDVELEKYRKERLSKLEKFYKKNKDVFPELNKFLEEKIAEEKEEVKNWEKTIKETNYLEWSKRISEIPTMDKKSK
ncbi:hypothetical protein [endosymbiont GvMRE of Glomus versiforme]|uniref:hypothetical protein n=1 Tax=endosymbiont GvMRE of Glomus versiforme TaxID=2039283 RepID=UPI000EB8D781|nr:hypothetical protein [endosymbiont GvMRE of Glomus versiforme]RHZ35755.1 hypothetical protein GvMRE_Ic6g53 [endosymbiont GvMRE of Glomus versiforme]